ncbi:MAG: hypothetical protein D6718_13590 [Acidobacteria bacterium]|nr:MAG: hypothetical protein D6718_13590 [Acidobacteriota bacterium]
MKRHVLLAASLFFVIFCAGTVPARACVTCSADHVCQAADGNGAERCSSWRLWKFRRCKLRGHCEATPGGGGGVVQPESEAALAPARRRLVTPVGIWTRSLRSSGACAASPRDRGPGAAGGRA